MGLIQTEGVGPKPGRGVSTKDSTPALHTNAVCIKTILLYNYSGKTTPQLNVLQGVSEGLVQQSQFNTEALYDLHKQLKPSS